jgi:outer membrane protein assembly factor BamE (lipoprotein component of BamABCDE complex)
MLPFKFFFNQFSKQVVFIYILLLSTSCIKNYQSCGYNFDLSNQNILTEGVHDQESVLNLMGSPSFVHNFSSQDLWVYYSYKNSHILFFKPKIIETKILLLTFDENKILAKKEDLRGKSVSLKFNQKLTNLENITKQNILSDFIQNIGRVNSF